MSDCSAFACAARGCQATIHLHHDVEERLLRTHETFYCPAGHSNYFPGQTHEEKRIRQLERTNDLLRDRLAEIAEDRVEWTMQAKRCPLGCGWRVLRAWKHESVEVRLAAHLVDVHGATVLALDSEAVLS